jgi:hypothetical protein
MVIPSFLYPLIIGFIARQITKFGTETNWQKIREDLAIRVAALVPGEWFDEEVVAAVDFVVAKVESVLENAEAITALVTAIAGKKFPEAVAILRKAVCDKFGIDSLSGLFHA